MPVASTVSLPHDEMSKPGKDTTWTKITDTQPPIGNYLVVGRCKKENKSKVFICKRYNTTSGFHVLGSDRWAPSGSLDPSSVTHWCDIPQLPEELYACG